AAAGRGVQLPDRPAGPLRVLRPLALEVPLPSLFRRRLAARQLAAPLSEPPSIAGLPAARARGRLRARRRASFTPGRGWVGGAAEPAVGAALSERVYARGAGRDRALVRGPRLRLDGSMPMFRAWDAASPCCCCSCLWSSAATC